MNLSFHLISLRRREFLICFAITLFIKFFESFFLVYLSHLQHPFLPLSSLFGSGDTDGYLEPFYNLYYHHAYYSLSGVNKIYAGRMPYYGLLYYILLPFFSIRTIYFIQVIFQVFMEALSIVIFAQIIYSYTKQKLVFYAALIFMNLCLYVTNSSASLAPLGLGVAPMIFTWWFYEKYRSSRKLGPLFICGVMLDILLGLKPYLGVFYIILAFDIFWNISERKILASLIPLLTLGAFCIFITTLWSWRNYSLTHQFIPLTVYHSGVPYTKAQLELSDLLNDWGESDEAWNPKAMSSFFYSGKGKSNYGTGTRFSTSDLPVTSYYNSDSLIRLRDYISSIDWKYPDVRRDSEAVKSIWRFKNSYKAQFPFRYYCLNKFRLIYNFTIVSGSFYINSTINGKTNYIVLSVKLLQSLLYYIFLIGGFLGLFFYFKTFLIYSWVPIYIISFFPFIVHSIQLTYFIYSYPSLVLGFMLLINRFIQAPYFSERVKKIPALKFDKRSY